MKFLFLLSLSIALAGCGASTSSSSADSGGNSDYFTSVANYPKILGAVSSSSSRFALSRDPYRILDDYYLEVNNAGGGSEMDAGAYNEGACWTAHLVGAALSATAENERDFCEMATQDETVLDRFVTDDDSTFKYFKVNNSYMGEKHLKVRVKKNADGVPVEFEAFACGFVSGDYHPANYTLKTLDVDTGAIRYVYQVFDSRLNTLSNQVNFELQGTINADGNYIGEKTLSVKEVYDNGSGAERVSDFSMTQTASTLDFTLNIKAADDGNNSDYTLSSRGLANFSVDENLIETAQLGAGEAKIVFEGVRGGSGSPLTDPYDVDTQFAWLDTLGNSDDPTEHHDAVAAMTSPTPIGDFDDFEIGVDMDLAWDCALPDGEEWDEITLPDADEGSLGNCAEDTSPLAQFFDLCNQ